MKTHVINPDADYSAHRGGQDWNPPWLPTVVGGPAVMPPYAAYLLNQTGERALPKYDCSGQGRHIDAFVGALPGATAWQPNPGDFLSLPFSGADLMAATGAFTAVFAMNASADCRRRLLSNYNGSVSEASGFTTINPANGVATNITNSYSVTGYDDAADVYDAGRGTWQTYFFTFSQNQYPGQARPGKVASLIASAGQAITAAVESDTLPNELPTGGTRALRVASAYLDPGFVSAGALSIPAMVFYQQDLTPFLNPLGVQNAPLVQRSLRSILAPAGVYI